MPQNWTSPSWATTGNPDQDWDLVIHQVDEVRFYFGDPELFYILQNWELGIDNVLIAEMLTGGPNRG